MQGQGFSLDAIRKTVEDRVLAAVDGVLENIPNGQQYKDQFRQAIDGAMNDLQQQARSQVGSIGGLMGNVSGMMGHKPEQGNPPIH